MSNKFNVGDSVRILVNNINKDEGHNIGSLAYSRDFSRILDMVVERVLTDAQDSSISYVVSVKYVDYSKEWVFVPESALVATQELPKPRFRNGELVYANIESNPRPIVYTVVESKYNIGEERYTVELSFLISGRKFPDTRYMPEELLDSVHPKLESDKFTMESVKNCVVYDEKRGCFVMERAEVSKHPSTAETNSDIMVFDRLNNSCCRIRKKF